MLLRACFAIIENLVVARSCNSWRGQSVGQEHNTLSMGSSMHPNDKAMGWSCRTSNLQGSRGRAGIAGASNPCQLIKPPPTGVLFSLVFGIRRNDVRAKLNILYDSTPSNGFAHSPKSRTLDFIVLRFRSHGLCTKSSQIVIAW